MWNFSGANLAFMFAAVVVQHKLFGFADIQETDVTPSLTSVNPFRGSNY